MVTLLLELQLSKCAPQIAHETPVCCAFGADYLPSVDGCAVIAAARWNKTVAIECGFSALD